MKAKKILTFILAIVFICMSTVNFSVFAEDISLLSDTTPVSTFQELKDALMNSSVTRISVDNSITFTESIGTLTKGIPNRDVYIYGNADKGVVINSAQWTIYGNQNTNGKNTLYIENANITGRGTPGKDDYTDGRFFTGGGENGPNAYGWDVYAKDVEYVGARFVHLSNGILTFDGTNEIYTNCENAWVNHVIFKAGSIYISSNSGTGDYGAFYFNRGKGTADGTALIEEGAETYFNIGTAVQPVFTGDVYKTTIEENAVFDVKTIGHAVWYVAGNSSYYKLGNPEFNVKSGAIVNIKQVSASQVLNAKTTKTNPDRDLYVPVYFAKSGSPEVPGTITIDSGATFNVSGATGNSSFYARGVIRMGDGSEIILNSPKSFDIQNKAVNAPAISSNGDTAYGTHSVTLIFNETEEISTWNKLTSSGQYNDEKPDKTFFNISGSTVIKGLTTYSTSTDNNNFNSEFANQNYGRISVKGSCETCEPEVPSEPGEPEDETCKCDSGESCECETCECESCGCETCEPEVPSEPGEPEDETCKCDSGESCECETCECEPCGCETCEPEVPSEPGEPEEETCKCDSGEPCECETCECEPCGCETCEPEVPSEPGEPEEENEKPYPIFPVFPVYPSQPNNPDETTDPDEELTELPLEKNDHIRYLNGYPDGTVRPDNHITRAEAASIFYRILKSTYKDGASSKSNFNDISSDAWYGKAVSVLAEMGIIRGYEDGTFRGDQKITRAEFAAMASRFEKLKEYNGKNIFNDVSSDHWAAKYINSAYLKSWVNGYEDNTFKPEQNITRAEVVKIVNTMLDRLPETLQGIKSPYNDIFTSHWAYTYIIEASIEHSYVKTENQPEIWETTSYSYYK